MVDAQRKPIGRKPYDRQVISEWVFSTMDQRGAFEVTGREWSLARLVEALEDAFEMSRSTAYKLLPPIVERWQLSQKVQKVDFRTFWTFRMLSSPMCRNLAMRSDFSGA